MRRIVVTARDIKLGRRRGLLNCPVARAVQRAFPGQHVEVATSIVRIADTVWFMSVRMREWVYRFDDRGPRAVKPATFQLDDGELNG